MKIFQILSIFLMVFILGVLTDIKDSIAQTPSVAFKTKAGPTFNRDTDPNTCYNWVWEIEFFITNQAGLNPNPVVNNHFIVQHVNTQKDIELCNGNPDPNSPAPVDDWEVFNLVNGVDKDVNAEAFLDNRKTTVKTTLSAGYLQVINGVTTNPTPGNPLGSDGILSGQPNGFTPTMNREYKFVVDCCGLPAVETFIGDWKVSNTWGTYDETWQQIGTDSRTEINSRVKNVDGRPAN